AITLLLRARRPPCAAVFPYTTLFRSLELVEDGVKVNSICPGNFFDGPLWSDPNNGLFMQYLRSGKVPGARTIQDVKRSYESNVRSERHTSELQSRGKRVCRPLLEKKK